MSHRKTNIVRRKRIGSIEAPPSRPRPIRMLTGRQKELSNKAEAERERCRLWLPNFMRPGQSKPDTKEALCAEAVRELKISKSSFNAAWIAAIEDAYRHDWYEPRRNTRSKRPQ